MKFEHKSVLLEESLKYLDIKADRVYIDGTLGGAGHSSEIYKRLDSNGILIGLDQDNNAINASRDRLNSINGQAHIILENINFRYMKDVIRKYNINSVDGILLDLGVSSHQLDEAERGFSYQNDAPLDMRMDRRQELNAEIIVNEYSKEDITNIIKDYGEEKWASRIASFIVEARKTDRIETTVQLVEIIKAAIPASARRDGPHPAKRTFQAIRIAVNNELGILKKTIGNAIDILDQNGRLCIITFHSLEDRIVKNEFMNYFKPCTCPTGFPVCVCGKEPIVRPITRKPVSPSDFELEMNPRSRSAKLRVVEKI